MDEQNLEAAPVESTPPPAIYRDRSVGLIVFGILTILLGCVCSLFIPLMLFGQTMSSKTTGTPPNFSAILPGVSLYGVLAVALVWLGIGSIMARRWARALLLVFSWTWLIMGIVMVVFMAFLMPKILANMPSAATSGHPAPLAAAIMMGMIFVLLIFGVFFVILPGLWTFFYGSRQVKATCEARDPVVRWTDACPLPVLGCSLWLMVGVPMMLIMAVTGHGVMPFFGIFLSGVPGSVLCLAVAAYWSYSAWALYKLDRRGWWLIFIALCLFLVSSLLTYARHDVVEMYRLMGYPPAQIEQIQKSSFFTGNGMMWMMLFSIAPFLGYLIFIERFLRRKP